MAPRSPLLQRWRSPLECTDEGLSLVQVGRYHLHPFSLKSSRCRTGNITSNASDAPVWLFEKGASDGTSLRAGRADDDEFRGSHKGTQAKRGSF